MLGFPVMKQKICSAGFKLPDEIPKKRPTFYRQCSAGGLFKRTGVSLPFENTDQHLYD